MELPLSPREINSPLKPNQKLQESAWETMQESCCLCIQTHMQGVLLKFLFEMQRQGQKERYTEKYLGIGQQHATGRLSWALVLLKICGCSHHSKATYSADNGVWSHKFGIIALILLVSPHHLLSPLTQILAWMLPQLVEMIHQIGHNCVLLLIPQTSLDSS